MRASTRSLGGALRWTAVGLALVDRVVVPGVVVELPACAISSGVDPPSRVAAKSMETGVATAPRNVAAAR
jgi:hypothetical protein